MPPSNDAAEAGRVNALGDASAKQSSVGQVRSEEDNEAKPYILAGELGKGSFATVYKGYHEDSHAAVAIKTVSKSILKPKLLESLQSEIRIMKLLSHRHVVKLIDIVRAERNIYLIMEYCSGGDLTNYIKKRGKVETLEYVPSPGAAPIYYPHPRTGGLDEVVVRSFLRQLARALKFLRGQNLIHRDIKPQNLLLNPASPQELARGHPLGVPILKVADFGFAKSLPDAMMAETLCGSPLYMAPEILRYEKYDAKVDLWSVGAVLYETTTGKPPFRANNPMELLKRIEATSTIKFPDEDPAQLQKHPDLRPVPKDIKDLIRALLKRRPVDRATFDDFFTSTAMKNSKDQRRHGTRTETEGSVTNSMGDARVNRDQDVDSEAVVLGTIGRGPRVVTGALATIPLAMKEHDRPAPSPPVASPVTATASPAVAPPKVMFRRATGSGTTPLDSPVETNGANNENPEPGARIVNERSNPGATGDSDDAGLTKPMSPDGSFTHEMDDGSLRREYVLVGDTKAIELHRAVDELKTARRAPLRERKSQQQSPTFEKRQSDYFRQGGQDRIDTPPSANIANGKDGVVNTTFPPPPHPYAPPLSSSPSRNSASALTRALSIASKKLFGTPSSTRAATPYLPEREPSRSPKRMPPSFGGRTPGMYATPEEQDIDDAERDPMEDLLLAELEELAQKADVLTKWADEMFEYVKAIPQKPLPPSVKYAKRDSETDRYAEQRRNQDIEAEYNAVTCVALYILLMSFSQKGIDRLRVHQEGMKMRDPEGRLYVSEGFDDALRWFKEHFLKCNERAALVRTWLPENSSVEEIWLDQVVYDRALLLSRKAARMELLDPTASARECEALYEESLWCLYALQDDVMQRNNPYRDDDTKTIATWIEKTRKRLVSCQNKRKALEAASAPSTGAPNSKRTSLEVNAPQTPASDREERRYSPLNWERRASPRR